MTHNQDVPANSRLYIEIEDRVTIVTACSEKRIQAYQMISLDHFEVDTGCEIEVAKPLSFA